MLSKGLYILFSKIQGSHLKIFSNWEAFLSFYSITLFYNLCISKTWEEWRRRNHLKHRTSESKNGKWYKDEWSGGHSYWSTGLSTWLMWGDKWWVFEKALGLWVVDEKQCGFGFIKGGTNNRGLKNQGGRWYIWSCQTEGASNHEVSAEWCWKLEPQLSKAIIRLRALWRGSRWAKTCTADPDLPAPEVQNTSHS